MRARHYALPAAMLPPQRGAAPARRHAPRFRRQLADTDCFHFRCLLPLDADDDAAFDTPTFSSVDFRQLPMLDISADDALPLFCRCIDIFTPSSPIISFR
jgi:hypothetical protein